MGRGGADVLPASDGLLGSGGIEPEEMVREVPVVPHAAETDMGAHTMAAGYQLSHEEMGDREEDVVYRVIDAAIRDGRRIFSYSLENVHAAFNGFDQDGSGRMDIQGFEKAMHELDLGLTPDQIKEVFQASDTDGSGMIDGDELYPLLRDLGHLCTRDEVPPRPLPAPALAGAAVSSCGAFR